MTDSSSEGSEEEEEVLRNFDEEANLIVQSEALPKKSAERYLLVYDTYQKWREENKKSLSNSEENNLIIYFNTLLKNELKPPTLWSAWSMLRKTFKLKQNIDINQFLNLKSIIKTNAKGYKPKKAFVFKWSEIMKFMTEAADKMYLAMKVILVFGICGCLRCDEITNLTVDDVEDLGNKYLVSIHHNKNEYAGQFVIGNLFYETVKQYISLRPSGQFTNRLFINFREGHCYRQAIGRHKIGEVPGKIAVYLKLPNAQRYTGHSMRRTSATLLSESGANMQMIKQLGRWRSDMIAQGYIENSLRNRELIYERIVQQKATTSDQLPLPTSPKASTSAQADIRDEINDANFAANYADVEEDFNLDVNYADFEEDFNFEEIERVPRNVPESGFTSGNNNPILLPTNNQKCVIESFLNKPPIKLIMNKQSTKEPPPCKKLKINEDLGKQTMLQPTATNRTLNNQNNKPPIKLILNKHSTNEQPPCNKSKISKNSGEQTILQPKTTNKTLNDQNNNLDKQTRLQSTVTNKILNNRNNNDINSRLRENNLQFENCTFNSCTFNVSTCNCNKENDFQNE